MSSFYLDLLPWVVYCAALRDHTLAMSDAALLALATALLLGLRRFRSAPHRLQLFAVALFGLLFTAGQFRGLATLVVGERRAVASAAFGLALLVTSRRGWFVAPALSVEVPLREREGAGFSHASRRLSLRWGVAAFAVALSQGIGSLTSNGAWTTAFHWLVPMAIVVHGARATRHVIDESFDLDLVMGESIAVLSDCLALGASEKEPKPRRSLRLLGGGPTATLGRRTPD